MDDRTVGLVLRALRRRRGWRQVDLASRAGCSQGTVSAVERGHFAGTTVVTVRTLFAAVEARLQLSPLWRGAELDRLLDSEHAAVVAHLATRLERAGWEVAIEVTYSIAGERGSIDVLGLRPDVRAVLVAEVKSDIAAAEAVGRKLDEKRRLVPSVVRSRFGWTPEAIGAVLVLPESSRLRRLLAGPASALGRMFPINSRNVAAWLRDPAGPLAATWFLSDISGRSTKRVRAREAGRMRRGAGAAGNESSVAALPDESPTRILR
jgi:transcriptional regulator with XRE-family HTH domain